MAKKKKEYPYDHPKGMPGDKRHKRWAKQRKDRGFDDRELWSLDHSLAKYILPRLKAYRNNQSGFPGLLTEKEWNEILDKMIASFEFCAGEDRWSAPDSEWDKHREGLKLFGEYYFSLWN